MLPAKPEFSKKYFILSHSSLAEVPLGQTRLDKDNLDGPTQILGQTGIA